MKYIGNKTRLLDFIQESLKSSNIDIKDKTVIDLFSGTGSVSNMFLKNNCNVMSCDIMTYSIAEQYRINYFRNEPTFSELKKDYDLYTLDEVLNYLNNLDEIEGYFFNNYAPSGIYKRQYFSDFNAKKIDSIRQCIEVWKTVLPEEKYLFLLGILMCSADKVSNTSGTYGAYLKIWRPMALKPITLEKPIFVNSGNIIIKQIDVLECVKENKDSYLIYLDPPYNERQYASNFHVLENIVVYDKQDLKGKTGLRNYESQKSNYCLKSKVLEEFNNLISKCNTEYIVMSYSTEGLLSVNEIKNILEKKGTLNIYTYDYRRFKTNAWTSDQTGLQELLFVCKINVGDNYE